MARDKDIGGGVGSEKAMGKDGKMIETGGGEIEKRMEKSQNGEEGKIGKRKE